MLVLLTIIVLSILTFPAQASDLNQLSTSSLPTVTGTPSGVMATVLLGQETQINVRAGPGVFTKKSACCFLVKKYLYWENLPVEIGS